MRTGRHSSHLLWEQGLPFGVPEHVGGSSISSFPSVQWVGEWPHSQPCSSCAMRRASFISLPSLALISMFSSLSLFAPGSREPSCGWDGSWDVAVDVVLFVVVIAKGVLEPR